MKKLALTLVLFLTLSFSQKSFAGGDGDFHPNHLALFTGATSVSGTTGFTFGMDYEYRLDQMDRMFGIVVLADYAAMEKFQGIYALGVNAHPFMDFKLGIFGGLEFIKGNTVKPAFVFRGSLGYDYHIEEYSISPIISADLVHGHVAIVAGIGFGMGF